jgi:hypothetical protein
MSANIFNESRNWLINAANIASPTGNLYIGNSVVISGNITATTFTGNLVGNSSTASNIAGGAAGSIPYQTAASTTSFLANGTSGSGQVLQFNGTAPSWTDNYAAGKNKIINGDFGIWQRGTSFSSPTSGSYLSDRYFVAFNGTPTTTYSQITFTPRTAPVAGYEVL